MADGQEPEVVPGQEPETDKPVEPKGQEPRQFDEAVVTQLRQENAAARKARNELEVKLKEFEDRDKSEAEKAAERTKTLEAEAETAKAEALRMRVALSKKLPVELIDRLRGSTKEELEADADDLLKLVKTDTTTGFDGGARTPAPAGDMDALIRQAAGRT